MSPASRRRRTPASPLDLTADQEQALRDIDVALGRLRAPELLCEGLRRLTLAAQHGEDQATYLTLAGWSARDRLVDDATTHAPSTGRFTAATGHGLLEHREEHARSAHRAWQSALELRRLTSAEMWLPAPLEQQQLLHSVALALEAGGVPPAGLNESGRCVHTGYQASELTAAAVRLVWKRAPAEASGPAVDEGLTECRSVLLARGWNAERYRAAGSGPYLVVWPAGQAEPLL